MSLFGEKMEREEILKRCVYCGNEIAKESKEHIIQNALGGLYESTDICCGECNNIISKKIDIGFTKTFNGILSKIPDLVKTNNKKSKPMYTGKALFDGKIYDVMIKSGKVVSCPQLNKEKKCKISNDEFSIIAYDFPIENRSFRNGFGKIAFNYAIEQGIDFRKINSNVEITKDTDGKVIEINFDYMMIPFVPQNPLDSYIELETEMELYHNIILFSQDNMLWCYIDLFNTFQYYILLSDQWEGEQIHRDYMQLIQKLDREIPDMYLRKPKHILIYADFYKIEPTLDLVEFKRRVSEAIRLASNKISMNEKVEEKFSGYLAYCVKKYGCDRESLIEPLTSILLYFNTEDKLNKEEFRTKTLLNFRKREIVSYPMLIWNLLSKKQIEPREYIFAKFERMNKFLVSLQDIDLNEN